MTVQIKFWMKDAYFKSSELVRGTNMDYEALRVYTCLKVITDQGVSTIRAIKHKKGRV